MQARKKNNNKVSHQLKEEPAGESSHIGTDYVRPWRTQNQNRGKMVGWIIPKVRIKVQVTFGFKMVDL